MVEVMQDESQCIELQGVFFHLLEVCQVILDAAQVLDGFGEMVLDDAVVCCFLVHCQKVGGIEICLGEEIVGWVVGENDAAIFEKMIDETI